MGNAHSAQMSPAEQRALVQAARFTDKDIKRIYRRFKALDTDQNDKLDLKEFIDVPDIADVSCWQPYRPQQLSHCLKT